MADAEPKPPELIADALWCFACREPGMHKCAGCGNARYCSEKCQKKDWIPHKNLCNAFSTLEPRPSGNHYRCILFPAKSSKSSFIWAQSIEGLNISADIKGYFNGARSDVMSVRRSLGRDLGYTLGVMYSIYSVLDCRPNNRTITKLLRMKFKSDVWTNSFVAYGHHAKVLVDLDTSALAPILDRFRHEAKMAAARLGRRSRPSNRWRRVLMKKTRDLPVSVLNYSPTILDANNS
jgi:hypothetical protein